MKKLIGIIALTCAFIPFSHAQESAGKKPHAAQSSNTVGDNVRQAGRDVKATGRKVGHAVVTRCADGRHTIRGKAACAGHGGVSHLN